MLSRFHLIPERHVQTDRRTDGRTELLSISRDKKQTPAIVFKLSYGQTHAHTKIHAYVPDSCMTI